MTRLPDWQSRLSAYIAGVAQRRFAYGRLDCGLFAAGAIEAMTGVDIVPGIRSTYTTRAEGFAVVKRLSAAVTIEGMADALTVKLGMPAVAVLSAQRGDVVQLRRGRSSSLGIVAMHGTDILTPYRYGLLLLPIANATRAWRV